VTHACAFRRYSFSSYKCWGPHAAALYGSHAAFEALGARGRGPNHFFIPAQDYVYKARSTDSTHFKATEIPHSRGVGGMAWRSVVPL